MPSTEAQLRAAKAYYARNRQLVMQKRRQMYELLKHDVTFKAKHNAASLAFYYRKKAQRQTSRVMEPSK
jgi:hypothetical protein